MRWHWVGIGALWMLGALAGAAWGQYPGFGYSPGRGEGLDAWRLKRQSDFWNRTSPFFGDPYYDPLKTSPLSPFRAPQYHPWRGSPFRGDSHYDPYAPRVHRLDRMRVIP
ncbi:MAG: hypothetical protein AB7F89_08995 [Pirellulaceae bacterium]